MNLKEQLDALLDATAFDSTGTKIGAVRQVYVDDASGKVTFATVATGIFSADAIVPLHGARLLDDELHVDHSRDVVRDSPRPDHTEDALTPEQEVRLLEYYGIEPPSQTRTGGGDGPTEKSARTVAAGTTGADTASTRTPAAREKGATPTTRETSPIAAPGSTAGDKAGEKAGEKAGDKAEGATGDKAGDKSPTTTAATSPSGPSRESSPAAKASGSGPSEASVSGPAAPSGTASDKDTGGDGSRSRG